MDEMIFYPIKVSVCMIMLYGIYVLTLNRETHFGFNRIYLLFSIIISLIIPLLNIPLYSGANETGFAGIMQTVLVGSDNVLNSGNVMSSLNYITLIYLAGLIILFLRFTVRFISLILTRRQCNIEEKDGLYIALCKKRIAPFSFIRTIFIDDETKKDEQLDKIIMHEAVHARQLHSLDIIFAESICLLTWFNPVSWMIKAALKETHEYLADTGVSEQTPGYAEYFLLLTRNIIGVQPGLANNFNKSLTLKRMNMMKKPRSGRLSLLKALPVLPVLVLLFVIFSCQNSKDEMKPQTISASQNNEKSKVAADKMPEYPGGQEAMMNFLRNNVKYPESARKNGIQGKVLVTFTVSKTGKPEKFRIMEKGNELLDKEAVRVMSLMPNWVPGVNKGAPVDVELTLPIKFTLK